MGDTTQTPAKRATISLAITITASLTMIALLGDVAYLWIKAIHVVAVISWMAGMLYLPRLFIYHSCSERGSKQSETFKVMEQRLLRIIVNPAMIITWVLGLWLAWQGGWLSAPWFHAKFTCVLALSAAHGYFSAAETICQVCITEFAAAVQTNIRRWRLVELNQNGLTITKITMAIIRTVGTSFMIRQ